MNAKDVAVLHSTIGPKHDPYARTTYTAQVGPNHVRLVVCGLAGHALEINGAIQSKWHFGDPKHAPSPIEEFERLIGCTLEEVEEEMARLYSEDPMGHPSQYI